MCNRAQQQSGVRRECRQSLRSQQQSDSQYRQYDSGKYWTRSEEAGEVTSGSATFQTVSDASGLSFTPDSPVPDENVTGWAVQSGLSGAGGFVGTGVLPANREKLLAYIGIFVRSTG